MTASKELITNQESASATRHHVKSTTKHCVVQLQPEFTGYIKGTKKERRG